MREVRERIPEIERVVVVPYLARAAGLVGHPGAVLWDDWADGGPADRRTGRSAARRSAVRRFRSTTPSTSCTPPAPRASPSAWSTAPAGTLLQHLKELVLHTDLTRDDRIFYFTTCGWMMWNWLVSSLAVGATVVLFDGAPLAPPTILWDMAERERVTVFGTSAKYLALAEKEGLRAGADARPLGAPRHPLDREPAGAPAASTTSTARSRRDVHLASISGGTDIISCFALGNPIGPVWRGELQTRGLGMAVEVFDEGGRPVRGAGRRAGLHAAVPQHAGRLLERPRRRQVPGGLLRALSRASGGTATGLGSPSTTAW